MAAQIRSIQIGVGVVIGRVELETQTPARETRGDLKLFAVPPFLIADPVGFVRVVLGWRQNLRMDGSWDLDVRPFRLWTGALFAVREFPIAIQRNGVRPERRRRPSSGFDAVFGFAFRDFF